MRACSSVRKILLIYGGGVGIIMASTENAEVRIKWSSVQKKDGIPSMQFPFTGKETGDFVLTGQELVEKLAQNANEFIAEYFFSTPFKVINIEFNGRFKNKGGHCEWIEEGAEEATIMVASANSSPEMDVFWFAEVIAHELIHAKQMQKGELKWCSILRDFLWHEMPQKTIGLSYRQFGHEEECFDNQKFVSLTALSMISKKRVSESFACPCCGKKYQSRQGRYRHIKSGICQ